MRELTELTPTCHQAGVGPEGRPGTPSGGGKHSLRSEDVKAGVPRTMDSQLSKGFLTEELGIKCWGSMGPKAKDSIYPGPGLGTST